MAALERKNLIMSENVALKLMTTPYDKDDALAQAYMDKKRRLLLLNAELELEKKELELERVRAAKSRIAIAMDRETPESQDTVERGESDEPESLNFAQ